MTKRIKRQPEFELSLQIKDDAFINPPRAAQRNWLLNGAMSEMVHNLRALHDIASHLVPGQEGLPGGDRTQAELADDEIMEDWQIPLMKAMAEIVTATHGDLLEIGFGRGVSATFIQEFGARSHTVVECNDSIVERFRNWSRDYPDRDLRLAHGRWQDELPKLGSFDGVFFHTYPLNEEEFIEQVGGSVTFAEHFFPHAAQRLRDGGIFTYLSNEIDSLSRAHQRLLFKHFSSIELRLVRELPVPEQVRDAWWADSMVVVKAVR